jgi:sugar O-acyltransferase (sialic acid O-acetyltransferase NeuD family)
MKRVLIIGGVGEAMMVGAAIIDANKRGSTEYELAGYINDIRVGETLDGYPVLGGRVDIPRFIEEGYYFLNTLYKLDHQQERKTLFQSFNIPLERLAIFVHPLAFIAPSVKLSPGCIILPFVTILSDTTLGICCRLMHGAALGHDTQVGDHVYLAPHACIGSDTIIEDFVYFGSNCTTKGNLTFGRFSVVGLGSVVVKHVRPFEIVKGNPAKFLRYVRDKDPLVLAS